MATEPELALEEAWTVISSSLVKTALGDATGVGNTLISSVKRCLKGKARLISNLLHGYRGTDSRDEIQKQFEDVDRYEEACPPQLTTNSGESKAATSLSATQMTELRKTWPKFKNIEWKSSLFQDWALQEGILSEDGRESISDKTSEHAQHWAIFHLVLGLSSEDIFGKLLPILKEVGKDELTKNLEEIQKIKDDGKALSVPDIVNIINFRKIAEVLYQRGAIAEVVYRDMISSDVSSKTKFSMLQDVEWEHFRQSLKEKYPHLYEICPVSGPHVEQLSSSKSTSTDTSIDRHREDVENLSEFSDRAVRAEGNQAASLQIKLSQLEWCYCGKCRVMTDELDMICCSQDRRKDCLSSEMAVDAFIAGARRLKSYPLCWARDEAELHKGIRHILYRQVSILQHGRLGPGHRNRIPSCCLWKIRDAFPDPRAQYTGFRESSVAEQEQ